MPGVYVRHWWALQWQVCVTPDDRTQRDVGHGQVIAEDDDRLTWPERELVRQLGAKLFGRRDDGEPRRG